MSAEGGTCANKNAMYSTIILILEQEGREDNFIVNLLSTWGSEVWSAWVPVVFQRASLCTGLMPGLCKARNGEGDHSHLDA